MLSVTGVFREVGEKKPMRSFHRSFVIVPVGGGFCIINEMLQISPATSDQVKVSIAFYFMSVIITFPGFFRVKSRKVQLKNS